MTRRYLYRFFAVAAVSLTLVAPAPGQTPSGTSVDLQMQGHNPDFSSFTFTRPMAVGTVLPSSCQIGQFYFNTASSPGGNVYACTAPNVWTSEGSGVGMSAQLGDFAASLAGGTLTIGPSCSTATPCNVRIGNTVYSFRNPASITPAASGTALVLIYIDNLGNLTAASSATLDCGGCTHAPGVSAFPPGSIPLYNWTLTNGAFDAGGGTDFRALLSTQNEVSGTGILITQNAGNYTIAVDPTVVATQVSTPATSTAACSPGQFSFDTNYYYVCTAPNTWKRAALASF